MSINGVFDVLMTSESFLAVNVNPFKYAVLALCPQNIITLTYVRLFFLYHRQKRRSLLGNFSMDIKGRDAKLKVSVVYLLSS